MRKLFQHIRNQPKDVRNNYAFGFASTFTGIVALIWIVTKAGTGVALPEVAAENNPGSFYTLIKQVKEQAANAQAALKNQTSSEDKDEGGTLDIEAVIASSTAEVLASPSERVTDNATTTATTTRVAVPVLIGTTTATNTINASSTP